MNSPLNTGSGVTDAAIPFDEKGFIHMQDLGYWLNCPPGMNIAKFMAHVKALEAASRVSPSPVPAMDALTMFMDQAGNVTVLAEDGDRLKAMLDALPPPPIGNTPLLRLYVSPSVPSSGGEVVAWRWRWNDDPSGEWLVTDTDPREGATPTRLARLSLGDLQPLYASPPIPADGRDGIRVKPLVWNFEGNITGSVWRGISALGLGRYTVVGTSWWGPEPTNEFHEAADEDAAKDAAQQDYQNRVLSAIETERQP